MKKTLIFIALALLTISVAAQEKKGLTFTEASELTLLGKVFPNTPDPYKRMDFTKYGGWTDKDIRLLNMSTGIIVSFKTNSPLITVKTQFDVIDQSGRPGWANRGYDLYIKKGGKWIWAGNSYAPLDASTVKNLTLVSNMDNSMKECLLYLPIYSVEKSIQIGIEEGSVIEAGGRPFRHNIVIHGSSYMHGVSTIRAASTVPGFLTRMTGLQFNSLAVSGDCKMQPQFLNALKDAEADAFVFDAFSNPTAVEINERLFGFIEGIQSTHPGIPLIFISTIYRENRNFDKVKDKYEHDKEVMADKLMKEACKKYKDVYWIPSNASTPDHETSADGVHPGDLGYYMWAESIREPIVKILAKYGIK